MRTGLAQQQHGTIARELRLLPATMATYPSIGVRTERDIGDIDQDVGVLGVRHILHQELQHRLQSHVVAAAKGRHQAVTLHKFFQQAHHNHRVASLDNAHGNKATVRCPAELAGLDPASRTANAASSACECSNFFKYASYGCSLGFRCTCTL